VRAKCLLAHRGATAEALRLALEAVTMMQASESAHLRWHTLMSQAEVLALAGQAERAEAALHEAIRTAEQQGNLAAAQIGREALSPAAP
jgi:hypothetical protein